MPDMHVNVPYGTDYSTGDRDTDKYKNVLVSFFWLGHYIIMFVFHLSMTLLLKVLLYYLHM